MTLEDVVLAMGLVQRCANVMACAAAKNVVVILIKLQSIHLKDDERGSNTIFKKLQPKIRFRLHVGDPNLLEYYACYLFSCAYV